MKTLNSRIDSVEVYRRGARISRVAELLRDGDGKFPTKLKIENLPLALIDASFSVDSNSNEAEKVPPTVIDLRIGLEVPSTPVDTRGELADELEKAEKFERKLILSLGHVDREIAALGELEIIERPRDKKREPLPSPIDARMELSKFKKKRRGELTARRREIKDKLEAATRELRDLEEKDRLLGSEKVAEKHELRKIALVTLDSEAATCEEAFLKIDYQVPGACWAPAYSMRLDGEGDESTIDLRAVVRQNTGENWCGINLTLSSADPVLWADLHELNSKRLGRAQSNVPKSSWRPPPKGSEELFHDFDREFGLASDKTFGKLKSRTKKPRRPSNVRNIDLQGKSAPILTRIPNRGGRSEFKLDKTYMLVGSAKDVDVYLPDSSISDYHCEFVFTKNREFFIRKLAGASVRINEKGFRSQQTLHDGDLIQIGDLELLFEELGETLDMSSYAAAAMPGDLSGGVPSGGLTDTSEMMAECPPPAPMMQVKRSMAAPCSMPKSKRGGLLDGMLEASMRMVSSDSEGSVDSLIAPIESRGPDFQPFIDYDSLRLPAPEDQDRGHLRIARIAEIYSEFTVKQRISIVEISEMLELVERKTSAAESSGLPSGHFFPEKYMGFDYAYEANSKVEIPSDGVLRSIPLSSETIKTNTVYVTVPRESQQVYRTVIFTNHFAGPMLKGPVDIYLGDEFLSTSAIPDTASGAEISLGLGVEESVKVVRNTSFHEESAGLIHGQNELKHDIKIELVNYLSRSIDLEVRERVPVTQKDEKKIKVSISELNPEWESFVQKENEVDGTYRWLFKMEAGATQKLNASYTVSIPAKNELADGNRREG